MQCRLEDQTCRRQCGSFLQEEDNMIVIRNTCSTRVQIGGKKSTSFNATNLLKYFGGIFNHPPKVEVICQEKQTIISYHIR